MEFSCHTWGFNDLTLPEALGTIARLGFRYVDIGTGPQLTAARAATPKARDTLIAELRGDLRTFNLKVADFYIMLPRISLDDELKRQNELAAFRAMLPVARALEVPGVTVSPGLVHPEEDEDAWDRTVVALRSMLSAAQELELSLSIEPHLDSMAGTPERAMKLIEDVPGLELTLDWAHLTVQKAKVAEIEALLPYARHIQIRQATTKRLQTPFARGKIDLEAFMQTLRDADYLNAICIELMQTVDWHGTQKVDSIAEAIQLRDALRDLRDSG